jgi:hypothetical protein
MTRLCGTGLTLTLRHAAKRMQWKPTSSWEHMDLSPQN